MRVVSGRRLVLDLKPIPKFLYIMGGIFSSIVTNKKRVSQKCQCNVIWLGVDKFPTRDPLVDHHTKGPTFLHPTAVLCKRELFNP